MDVAELSVTAELIQRTESKEVEQIEGSADEAADEALSKVSRVGVLPFHAAACLDTYVCMFPLLLPV